ncbi:MAG: hypothetical protein IID32_07330 [Planctomycetes bacterium]|nr:hypothetical protein [Planctomycetota bacterium]
MSVNISTPTALGFFVACVAGGWLSIEDPEMGWFAGAALSFFIAIGPWRWVFSDARTRNGYIAYRVAQGLIHAVGFGLATVGILATSGTWP